MKSFNYESMGTHFEITVWDKIPKSKFDSIKKEIIKQSYEFDNTYSRFKPGSLVSKISKQRGRIKVPSDFIEMLRLYLDLYEPSEHKLNPLIGSALSDMGYDADYTLSAKQKISKVPDLKTVKILSKQSIQITTPLLFDFGALGKGYFVNKVSEFLKKQNVRRFLVNGSGDIYYQGNTPIKAGLEHPGNSTKIIGVVDMKTGAMCASSTNRRKWRNVHHIIDPTTLKPASEIIATWVVCKNAALADALATALFFVPPDNFSNYEFEYLLLNREYKVKKSRRFNAVLY